jgi:hypothetical protein
MQKYELFGEVETVKSFNPERLVPVRRIRALKSFGKVKKGDIGGRVESEANLSQEGNCWISKNSYVVDKARVYEDAIVDGCYKIAGEAQVFGQAQLTGGLILHGTAKISGDMKLSCPQGGEFTTAEWSSMKEYRKQQKLQRFRCQVRGLKKDEEFFRIRGEIRSCEVLAIKKDKLVFVCTCPGRCLNKGEEVTRLRGMSYIDAEGEQVYIPSED